MKICHVCAVDFTLYHFLLPLMEATRDTGHDVVGVCADGPFLDKVRERGLRVETIPFVRSVNPGRNLAALSGLVRLFRRERFDLVHVHTPVASLVGRLAAALTSVPRIVYTAHGFFFHENMPLPKRVPFVALEWLGGRLTHTLFTQAAEDAVTARRLRLCRTGDVLAIGNGSDPLRFCPADRGRCALRQAMGTPADRVVIVMMGRLVAEKGYPELLQAIRDVDADLWIVGERLRSDHASPIDDLIHAGRSDPQLNGKLRFLGYRNDVPDLLRAADIFTLPSRREGMPRSVVEAMLTGLPVVATDIRGTREEIVHGETGLLVPVGDPQALAAALQSLVEAPRRRRQFGAAGRQRATAMFDEANVIQRQIDHLKLAA